MNDIKTYLSNLTQADIQRASREELATILDYMEQVKGDPTFSSILFDKVKEFKQYAVDANNKILLEASAQEQLEKQELMRERIRFVRQMDYIERFTAVQNNEETEKTAQRVARQQQQQMMSMALQQKIIELNAFFNSKEYQRVLENVEQFVKTHPNLAPVAEMIKKANEVDIKQTVDLARSEGVSPEKVSQLEQGLVSFKDKQRENVCLNGNNEEAYLKQSVVNMTDLMLNVPEGTEPYIQNIVGDLKKAIEKHYGQQATPELLERFKQEFKSGEVTLDDLGKYANNIQAIKELAELEKIREKREILQDQIKNYKDAGVEPPEELVNKFNDISFKEMSLKTVSLNIKSTEGVEGLSQFKFVFYNDRGELGTVFLRSKNDSEAMSEFACNVLKVGAEDIIKNSANNNADLKVLLDEFVSDKTKFEIMNLTENKKAAFNNLNREYAKLRALATLQNDTNDEIVKADLIPYVEGRKQALKKAYREYKGNNGETFTEEEVNKIVGSLTLNDLQTKNPYQIAAEFIEKRKNLENVSKNEPKGFSLEELLQKLKEKEPLATDEKQFVLEQLSLQGKSLGQIKEEYPVFDTLVSKEFEAVALGKDKVEQKVETPEQRIDTEIKADDIGVRI